ncbi:hypothetical protein JB92DRAFT_3062552, partial [Gautieria morchelliformis]
MFGSLWNFIHNLFLSLMSDNERPVPPFVSVEPVLNPAAFYNRVCDVPITDRLVFVVREIKWYKQRTSVAHEYLLARLQRRGGSRAMYATIERGPARSANQVQVSSTSSPSVLSKDVSAYDLITCLSQEDMDKRITGDRLLATYMFTELPLLEFFRIVRIVSQYSPNYELDSTMCYWFSGVIIEVARRQFDPHHPGNRPVSADPPRGAGYYTVINTMTSQWAEDYNIIEQIYKHDSSTNENPIGPQLELIKQRERDARDEGVQQGLQQG